ncbi:hypothetical protein ACWDE9_46520, partial [Streptomyces olivaceoviridis]
MSPSAAPSSAAHTPERPDHLAELLSACVDDPARVTTDIPRRVAAAHDASPYLFTPRAVVRAVSAAGAGQSRRGAGTEQSYFHGPIFACPPRSRATG